MDISTLKEKLGDETFAKLESHVNDLIGQRDAARRESIDGRKTLKKDRDDAIAERDEALEWAGVDSIQALREKPGPKGLAEASQQVEAKLKKMQRDLDSAVQQRDDALGKFRGSLQKASIAEALAGHEFVDREVVESFVSQRLKWEGDELLFTSGDGKLIPVKDGVAEIAKTRPQLLKASGTGGAGVRQSNAGSGGGKTMTRAQFDAASPAERMAHSKAGGVVVDG